MKILVDYQIAQSGNGGRIGPASTDLHTEIEDGGSIVLEPGKSVLLGTQQYVGMEDNQCALLVMRTSAFRKGLALASPGWVDPGYAGQLTFRVTNVVDQPIKIDNNDRIIQMIIFQLDDKPNKPYRGVYQGSVGAVGFREPEDPDQ
jgi:dCTP deaminase